MSVWMQLNQPVNRHYRLIDAALQPHPHLDGIYDSLDAALSDATAWSRQGCVGTAALAFGVEVSTSRGQWRTVLYPKGPDRG